MVFILVISKCWSGYKRTKTTNIRFCVAPSCLPCAAPPGICVPVEAGCWESAVWPSCGPDDTDLWGGGLPVAGGERGRLQRHHTHTGATCKDINSHLYPIFWQSIMLKYHIPVLSRFVQTVGEAKQNSPIKWRRSTLKTIEPFVRQESFPRIVAS